VVRELGLERRETVRSLSTVVKKMKNAISVREEQVAYISGRSAIFLKYAE